jgi:hypothetical protein
MNLIRLARRKQKDRPKAVSVYTSGKKLRCPKRWFILLATRSQQTETSKAEEHHCPNG